MAATTVAGTSRAFFIAVLNKLGIPPSEGALNALYAVEHLEGDNQRYNPLNVIQPEAGSHAFNSVGVQSYANFDTGVQGTATLLSNSHWTGVRAALKTGDTNKILAAFQDAYTWDKGVHFPLTSDIETHEANRLVGPGNPSAQLAAQITGIKIPIVPGTGVSIGTGDATITPGSVAGGAVNSVVSTVAGPVMVWVAKLSFVAIGGLLVVVGLYRASEHGDNRSGLIDDAKAAAALAA